VGPADDDAAASTANSFEIAEASKTTPGTRYMAAQGPIPGVPTSLRVVQVAESYVRSLVHPQRCNCKRFVQSVVAEATAGAIAIPTTAAAPNQFRWNMPAQYVQQVATSQNPPGVYGPFPTLSFGRQGDIVQLKPRSGGVEHTAIFAAVDGVGARLVEANYTGCTVTNTRYVTFESLSRNNQWTLYRLTR
jgi:hypothetical protein